MSKIPTISVPVTHLLPQDAKNIAWALREIAHSIEAGHNTSGGIVVHMPTDTSMHLRADFTISLAKGECLHDFVGRAPDGGPISIQQPVHYACTKCGQPEE